jgi:hypothetical protein
MFVFGGVDGTVGHRTNDLLSVWLSVPKLRDLSWEATNSSAPNLAAVSAEELLSEGVPRDLVRGLVHRQLPSQQDLLLA